MSETMTFDLAGFNAQVEQVRSMIGRNAGSYVRTTARRLVKRLSFNAPIAPRQYGQSGRLRAGFWPAAQLLNVSNIYTRHSNTGEGAGEDLTRNANPSFTITNSVPYVTLLKEGMDWADKAVRGVEAQMAIDLERYARDSWEKLELIDDLMAE